MTVTDRIEIDPDVMLRKPVIRGTRIPVELILRRMSEGASDAELLDAYPRLAQEDIEAAIRYAADALAHGEVVFICRSSGRSDAQLTNVELGCGVEMDAIDRITMNPGVCGGRPCIRDLRIRVKDVLDLLAAGATREEILSDQSYLEPEDITAVLEFAARQSDHPILRSA